jgi:hypothetical protein
VYIEERYRLRNSGTAVTPPYSRWNLTEQDMYGTARDSPHIRALPLTLPPSAEFVYSKDDLGATQTVVEKAGSGGGAGGAFTRVTLSPRYPLLGGWQTETVLGYSVPLQTCVVARNGGGGGGSGGGTRRTLVFLQPPLLDKVRSLHLLLLLCAVQTPGRACAASRRCCTSCTHACVQWHAQPGITLHHTAMWSARDSLGRPEA